MGWTTDEAMGGAGDVLTGEAPVVRTVLGDIDAQDAGIALIHEHLHMDMTAMVQAHGYQPDREGDERPFDAQTAGECRWNPGAHPANYRFDELEPVLDDLHDAFALGVRTVVDATPVDIGRDPVALQRLAQGSGLHIVMGTGYYLAASHARMLREEDAERRAFDLIMGEHENGVDGVRPGLIGEIGTSDPPVPSELGVLRGSASAARETGLALTVHVHPWGFHGESVLLTAVDQGLAPGRVILNHMSTAIDQPDYLRRLLVMGATLSFDLFGFDHSLLGPGRYAPSDDDVAACVVALAREGWTSQLVLSQDVGVRTRLRRYGGWGYGHLLRHVVPLLVAKGLDDEAITTMLVENPRRLLTIDARDTNTEG
jgi:phosphotriesterase-related protein